MNSAKIHIEGKLIDITTWVSNFKIVDSTPEYAKHVYNFLIEWFSDKEIIHAQTSGSTGTPKSIALQKSAMKQSAKATGAFFGFDKLLNNKQLKLCCPLSVKFIAGKMMLVRAIEWNAIIYVQKPSENPLELIQDTFDFMVMTPHQIQVGFEQNQSHKLDLISTLLLGGSPISKELELHLSTFKNPIFIGYGMTETMSHVAIRQINSSVNKAIYTAVPNVTFSSDNRSCLVISAFKLFEEPLITNDVIELLDDTHFSWKGRWDHVINSGGIKVFPENIENKISAIIPYPYYIKGIEDPKYGTIVGIFIESEKSIIKLKNELEPPLKHILSPYEMPKKWIVKNKFDYTENGKIIKLD